MVVMVAGGGVRRRDCRKHNPPYNTTFVILTHGGVVRFLASSPLGGVSTPPVNDTTDHWYRHNTHNEAYRSFFEYSLQKIFF
jgi:hypothetical protein